MILTSDHKKALAVWLARIISGAVFMISGWAKCVDPWGFVYKIQEYLHVWQFADAIPVDIVVVGAVALSIFEFVTGILLVTGSMRRVAPALGLALMVFMLPLTAYIAIADPVADCGCFGDLLVLSNTATFIKNLILTGLLVVALKWHSSAGWLFRPGLQWLVIILSSIYALSIAFIGWNVQPLVDFRPYPVGSEILREESETAAPQYIYAKDGVEQRFTLDALPDSTWTFIEAVKQESADEALAIYDGDDEVTAEVFDPDEDVPTIVLAISDPDVDFLTRARFANELAEYADSCGMRMIGLVAASGDALDRWIELARPDFDVYSATDTAIKQLVRGNPAIVLVDHGKIALKRTFISIRPELPVDGSEPLADLAIVDDGKIMMLLTSALFAALFIIWLVSRYSAKDVKVNNKE